MSQSEVTSLRSALMGFVALIGLLAIGLSGLWAAVLILKLLDSGVTIAFVSAAATICVSIMSLLVAKYLENRQKIDQENRLRKIPVYEEHLQTIFRVLYASREGLEPAADKEIARAFSGFTEKLLLWGSEDVIVAWTKFRLATHDSEKPLAYFQQWAVFLKALRRDVGIRDRKITDVALLGLFINDVGKIYGSQR